MKQFTVKDQGGDTVGVYEGVDRLYKRGVKLQDMIAAADKLALVWSDGEFELWTYDGVQSQAEAEIRRYYRDSYGWPDGFTQVFFYTKAEPEPPHDPSVAGEICRRCEGSPATDKANLFGVDGYYDAPVCRPCKVAVSA